VFARRVALVACFLGATQAQSIFELPKGRVEVAGFGGAVSGFGSNAIVGGGANVAVTNRLLVGGEFGYIPGGNHGIFPVGGVSINAKAYEITGGVYYRFLLENPKLVPYLGVGFATVQSSVSYQGINLPSVSLSNSGLGFGGGLRYHLTPRLGIRPEFKLFAGGGAYSRVTVGLFYQFK
jgi:hypothetical protein